jgi:chromate transporter
MDHALNPAPTAIPLVQPTRAEQFAVFGRIGLLSFGGPAGQIALMHQELVDKRHWIDEGAFLRALNFCHFLPGPEAQQLATYIGWRIGGWRSGVVAGTLFVLPGALVILALSILYALAANLSWFAALFVGIKAAVLAIVVQALIRMGSRALDSEFKRLLAFAAFLALFVFAAPFPLVILGAALAGWFAATARPVGLGKAAHAAPDTEASNGPRPTFASLRALLVWGAIWAAPIIAVLALLGPDHVLMDIAKFFSTLAVVTFGGAYAVLAYMAQEAVQTYGWLNAGEMADGLGLAESTPGPLILVTQFVGFLGAYRDPAPFDPMVAGIVGAALTTWVTFAPCFLWIFALAPWIERLEHARRLQGALAAVTAAVVGVIANLTLWFALHVLFARVGRVEAGPVSMSWPEWASIDTVALGLAVAALVLALRFKWSVFRLLGAGAVAGLVLALVR